jgi:hypothetical protein
MPQLRSVLAALFAGVCLAHGDVQAAPRAGVAAAVRGQVMLERPGSVGLTVETGAPIFIGDEIKTSGNSGLQILLLDETVFTLGPNSSMKIDEFVFDPSATESKLDAELVRGAFRFISGRIAKQDPDKMKVKLPSGTIGIRGTVVDVQIDPTQGRALVLLAGPGEGNSAGVHAGHIRVDNAGVSQDVTRSGWGVEIPDAGSPPSDPFPFPPEMLAGMSLEIRGDAPAPNGAERGDGGEIDGESATSDDPAPSGDGTRPTQESDAPPPPSSGDLSTAPRLVAGTSFATGREGARIDQQFGGALDRFSTITRDPAQIALTQSGVMTSIMDLVGISAMFSGHFFYDVIDLPFASRSGSLDLFVDLDFNNQVVGIQVLGVESTLLGASGSGSGATSVPFTSGLNGNASFVASFAYMDSSSQLCGPNGSCTATTKLDFFSDNGQPASRLQAGVSVKDDQGGVEEITLPVEVGITSTAGSMTLQEGL